MDNKDLHETMHDAQAGQSTGIVRTLEGAFTLETVEMKTSCEN